MRLLHLGLGAIAVAGVTIGAAVALWPSPPPLVYETVMGYPMQVYFRNVGSSPVQVVAAGGLPKLSDEPLPQWQIDAFFESVKTEAKPADSLVHGGDFVRFEVADPDGLAWEPGKIDHTTYFYLFAVVEMPRQGLVSTRWVRELCLVSKTHEPFQRCPTHNAVYAGG